MNRFKPKQTLTEGEIQAGLSAVMNDGLASQAVGTLTGGVFLVAFALKLGASNFVVGLVAAVLPLAQLLQIPSVYLVEKYRSRRAITVYAIFFCRICWLFIAAIPFLFSPKAGMLLLLIVLALNSGFAAVSVCGWNPWMRDLIPQDRLGSFFSKRMSLATALGIPLSLAAGVFLDYWKKYLPQHEIYGYSGLFFLGFIAGMIGIYFLSITPEPEMKSREINAGFPRMILEPFKDTNFKYLIVFFGFWTFATNLALPFFTVYMLKALQLNMSFVIALTVLSQLMNLTFIRIWGRLSDLFGNKPVLSLSSLLFVICTLVWTFTTMPDRWLLTIPLLIVIHILMGISTAGFILAGDNLAFKLAPSDQATAYLAAKNMVRALAAGIAPVLAGKFVDFLARYECFWAMRWTGPKGELAVQIVSLQHWDFFFLLSGLIGLYAINRLTLVKEKGAKRRRVVIYELKAEMKRSIAASGQLSLLVIRSLLNRLRYQPPGSEVPAFELRGTEGACPSSPGSEMPSFEPIMIETVSEPLALGPDDISIQPTADLSIQPATTEAQGMETSATDVSAVRAPSIRS